MSAAAGGGANRGGGPTAATSRTRRFGPIIASASGYRERCRLRRVTDHTSAGGARSGKIKKALTETGIRTPLAKVFQDRPRFERRETAARPVCIVCGRVKEIGQEREER